MDEVCGVGIIGVKKMAKYIYKKQKKNVLPDIVKSI
jgi:hypothetical protein